MTEFDPLTGFKGSKKEWALYYMECHMLPTAKDYDNTWGESAIRLVLGMLKEARKSVQSLEYQLADAEQLIQELKQGFPQ